MDQHSPQTSQGIPTPPEQDKPFQCDGCRKGFNMNENLQQHKDIHRGQAAQEAPPPPFRQSWTPRSRLAWPYDDFFNALGSDHGMEAEAEAKDDGSPSTTREKSQHADEEEKKKDKEDRVPNHHDYAAHWARYMPGHHPPFAHAHAFAHTHHGHPRHGHGHGHGHGGEEKENAKEDKEDKEDKEADGHPDPSSRPLHSEWFADPARRGGRGGRCGRGGRGMHGHHHAHHHHGQHAHGARKHGGPFWPAYGPMMQGMYDLVERNVAAATAALYTPATTLRNERSVVPAADGTAEDVDFSPAVDVFATENGWTLHAELAGAKKEDMAVSWDPRKGELVLTGVVVRPGDEAFLRGLVSRERRIGMFERRLRLPPVGAANPDDEVDGDAIAARMEHGVLIVTVPRKEKEWTEVRKVDIN